MRQYERNDVIIDQCVECGGIFLDRGELERLAQAEANFYNPQAAQPLPPRGVDDRWADERRSDRRRDDDDRHRRESELPRSGYSDDRDYRQDRDARGYRDARDYRDDRGSRDDRDYRRERDYDPRYDKGRYGKRRKKESFFGELMDLLD